MCGILGVGRFTTGGLLDSNVRAFHDLLIADQVRGMDGTGIVRVKKNYKVELRKIRGNTIDLLRADGVGKWLSRSAPDCDQVLIGHNRYATTANGTHAHAHPFSRQHITLVHNGTLHNPDDLVKGEKFDVDSDALTNAIAKLGIKEALMKAQGAISIVYYDRKERTLNFWRNFQRPMFIHFNPQSRELLFGSEKKMVEWAGDRNNIPTVFPEELTPYTLRSYSLVDGVKKPDVKIDPWEHNRENSGGYHMYPGASSAMDENGMAEFDESAGRLALPGPKGAGVEEVNDPEPDTSPEPPPVQVHSGVRNIMQMRHGAGRSALLNILHVDEMFGYRKDSLIQWTAVQSFKSSKTQDQWKVVGCVIDARDDAAMARVEVHCFVKSIELAKKLEEAHFITAKVRSMERPRIGFEGTAIIWVSDNMPSMSSENLNDTPAGDTKVGEVLPPEQVETTVIVDLKGSKYDPAQDSASPPVLTNIVEIPVKPKSLIQAACVGFLGDSTSHHKFH